MGWALWAGYGRTMTPLLHPSLANDRFADPALYVEFMFEKRALSFELGGLDLQAVDDIVDARHRGGGLEHQFLRGHAGDRAYHRQAALLDREIERLRAQSQSGSAREGRAHGVEGFSLRIHRGSPESNRRARSGPTRKVHQLGPCSRPTTLT